MGEVSTNGCEERKLGSGECADHAYVGVLKYKPNYAEFLIDEGERDHIDMKELLDRAMYKDIGVTVDIATGASE